MCGECNFGRGRPCWQCHRKAGGLSLSLTLTDPLGIRKSDEDRLTTVLIYVITSLSMALYALGVCCYEDAYTFLLQELDDPFYRSKPY